MTLSLITAEEPQDVVRMWVPGEPQTAGSKDAIPFRKSSGSLGVRVKESGQPHVVARKKTWRATLQETAMELTDYSGEALWTQEPLAVTFCFVRRRTGGHLRTGRHAGQLKPWAVDMRPVARPDALKLARAAEDALSQILWADDSQIVEEHLYKVYGDQVGLSTTSEGMLLVAHVVHEYDGPSVTGAK